MPRTHASQRIIVAISDSDRKGYKLRGGNANTSGRSVKQVELTQKGVVIEFISMQINNQKVTNRTCRIINNNNGIFKSHYVNLNFKNIYYVPFIYSSKIKKKQIP